MKLSFDIGTACNDGPEPCYVRVGSGAGYNLQNLNGRVFDRKAGIRGVIAEENCRFRFRPVVTVAVEIN